MDVIKRRMFLSGGVHTEGPLHKRDKICAVEIWVECFGGDPKYMKRSDSMEINNILLHGKWQRIKTPRNFGHMAPFLTTLRSPTVINKFAALPVPILHTL